MTLDQTRLPCVGCRRQTGRQILSVPLGATLYRTFVQVVAPATTSLGLRSDVPLAPPTLISATLIRVSSVNSAWRHTLVALEMAVIRGDVTSVNRLHVARISL